MKKDREAYNNLEVGIRAGLTGDKLSVLRLLAAKEMDDAGMTEGFADCLLGFKKETSSIRDPLQEPMTKEDWAMISMGGCPF